MPKGKRGIQMVEMKVRNRITKEERTVWKDLKSGEVELSDIHSSKTYEGEIFFQDWEPLGLVQNVMKTVSAREKKTGKIRVAEIDEKNNRVKVFLPREKGSIGVGDSLAQYMTLEQFYADYEVLEPDKKDREPSRVLVGI
ncbi:MAG: hypothetical protein MUO31_01385 [Thermodesulfovibrionales bacterium]|nr:hypothetical protein [Thermodesulfovibrionales bacterium]